MRKRAGVLALLLGVATFVPVAAGAGTVATAHPIAVNGTFHGHGGFEPLCRDVRQVGDGRFTDAALGHGRYSFTVCLTIGSDIAFHGSFSLQTRAGMLAGTIDGTNPRTSELTLPIVVTGGTKQFARARGLLTIGPLHQTDRTNCDPQGVICADWKDHGPISGTITRVGSLSPNLRGG